MGVYKLSGSSVKNGKIKYSSFLAGNPAVTFSSYESIATASIGSGGVADVTFSSIPNTYTHLQVRAIARSAEAASGEATLRVQINSDTNANYATHGLGGNGSSASADNGSGSTFAWASYLMPKNNTTANVFGSMVFDILDYANTNKFKTFRNLSGSDLNGSGSVFLTSGLWRNTSAITSLKFYFNGNNIVQYSHFALYGIKAA
jgi:hypothetical protein